MELSPDSLELVKHFEGYRQFPYDDVVGKSTVGYGHLIIPGEDFEAGLTEAEAAELCLKDLTEHADSIGEYIQVPLTPNQAGAISSLAFNLGVHAIADSTLVALTNASNFDGAALEFPKWCHAGGNVLPGLVKRRNAEKLLFEGKDWTQYE